MATASANQQLLAQLSRLRASNAVSDLEIACQGRTRQVHGLVLGFHSQALLEACNGQSEEAHERRIDLSAHDPDAVNCLVTYMYILDYTREHDAAKLDVSLCTLADHLGLALLKELASRNCTTYIGYWGGSHLERCLDKIVEVISVAYDDSDATREICTTAAKKLVDLRVMENMACVDAFRGVMARYPEFAVDLVIAAAEQVRFPMPETPASAEERAYTCANCRRPNHKNLADVGSACLSPCSFCSFGATGAAWSLLPVE